jgi:lipopolysaccharide export system permease protein
MLKILDRYILGKFLGTFIFSISLILAIFIVFDIKEKIQTFVTNHIPLEEIIGGYYLMFIPVYGNLFSPLFTFISIIFFTSKMAHRSEFVAILGSGASFNRILRPYLIGAFIIGMSSLLMNHFLIPRAQKIKIGFEDKWVNNQYSTDDKNIHKRIAPNTILYLQSYDNRKNIAYKVSLEKFVNQKQTYMMQAESMEWDSVAMQWNLKEVFERNIIEQDRLDTLKNQKPIFHESHKFYPEKKLTINFTPADMWRYESKIEIMPTPALINYIHQEQLKGSALTEFFEVELHRRTSFPFATFILTIIGVSISSRKVRGGVGLQIALGLFLSCIYIMFMYIFTTIATTGNAPTLLAVWTPNIIFSFVAFYFYKKAQQ